MLTETPQLAPDGHPFRLVTLRNSAGMLVTLMDWGATLLSCRVPLKDGSVRETLLGCATVEDYLRQSAYLGASVGRYANRIAGARYRWQGEEVELMANQGKHQLHGGPEGFDKRRWMVANHNESEVTFTLTSPDGDQGFPGNAWVQAHYQLDADNSLSVSYRVEVDKPCPVNLTNHAYFNLEHDRWDARDHILQIHASHYLPVDAEGIPCRELTPVAGTSFDFQRPKAIRRDFLNETDQRLVNGYDHAFLLAHGGDIQQPAAELWSADKHLQMTLYTSAPALHFYSGNFLAGTPARENGEYDNWQGIALESELLPDSPNHPEWPQPAAVINPGEEYLSVIRWHFIAH
ncbi:aldose 1-epimerase [Salmonella enterica subsp. enterica serovar Choleraesuis]|nr:aldose 1-epimerase [Salmonella enterica subsp. enterica serovar Choleraesuis]